MYLTITQNKRSTSEKSPRLDTNSLNDSNLSTRWYNFLIFRKLRKSSLWAARKSLKSDHPNPVQRDHTHATQLVEDEKIKCFLTSLLDIFIRYVQQLLHIGTCTCTCMIIECVTQAQSTVNTSLTPCVVDSRSHSQSYWVRRWVRGAW